MVAVCFVDGWYEVCHLGEPIDNDQDGRVAVGRRQLHDEVH